MVERPVLRYHGGKWRLAPWIISHFPPHRIYVEPFGGGGSVLMRKSPSYAEVYNDLDERIVRLFRILRDPVQAAELERLLWLSPFARKELELAFVPTDDVIEEARRTIMLALQGFGSDAVTRGKTTGFRKDSNRSGTTPAKDWSRYPLHIRRFTARLLHVVIECRDALKLIPEHDSPDTLYYVDPPYVRSTRTSNGQHGYRHEMTDDDHRALAEVLHRVEGMVVLSGYPSELYSELYRGWHVEHHRVLTGKNIHRVERLWISPATMDRLHPRLFTRGGEGIA